MSELIYFVHGLPQPCLLCQRYMYDVLHTLYEKMARTEQLINQSPHQFRCSNKAHNFQFYPSCNRFGNYQQFFDMVTDDA